MRDLAALKTSLLKLAECRQLHTLGVERRGGNQRAEPNIAERDDQLWLGGRHRIAQQVQTALVVTNRCAHLGERGLAAACKRQLVERCNDERIVARQADAAEENIQIRARDVAAEGDARCVRAQNTGTFAPCVAGCCADPQDVDRPPRTVAPAPGQRAIDGLAGRIAARLIDPFVAQTIGVMGVCSAKNGAKGVSVFPDHLPILLDGVNKPCAAPMRNPSAANRLEQVQSGSDMTSNVRKWKMVRKLALLAFALGACGDPDLKVGLNVGLAGADIGRMAATEIRMGGAATDRRFDVRVAAQTIIARNELTPEILTAALDSLAADEDVGVIVSRFLQQEELDAARRFTSAGMPFLAVTPLPEGIASASGPGFSLVPSQRDQAAFLAEQARASDRISIIHIDNAYGRNMTQLLTAALAARGVTPVDVREYKQAWDEPRMVALGTEVEKVEPTAMFFFGRAPSLELVWQPFREAAKDIRVYAGDLVESTALYANPAGRYTGLRYVRYIDPRSKDPRMTDLNDRYWMWISRGEMTNEAVMVYDALTLVGEAMRAGARTRPEFIAYFASLGSTRPPFKGVGGLVQFTAGGEVQREMHLAEVTYRGVVMPGDSLSTDTAQPDSAAADSLEAAQ